MFAVVVVIVIVIVVVVVADIELNIPHGPELSKKQHLRKLHL